MSSISSSQTASGRAAGQAPKPGRYAATPSTGKRVSTTSKTDQRALEAAARTLRSVDKLLENRRASAKR